MKKKMKNSVDSRATEKRGINNINTLVEIPMYAPNMGLTPKEYQISPQLNDLEKRFKEECVEFLSKASPDEFNSSYMDAVIERICIDAIRFIKVQRCDHKQLITKMLAVMHVGDYCKAVKKLQVYLNDRDKNERELKKWRRILWSGTSLEEEV
ncbi:MAG: hypothetical protein K2G45_12650 [Lachnospiraceae bacterium]|nr:hypothetical protein [Lachnospiraceae bacterium]